MKAFLTQSIQEFSHSKEALILAYRHGKLKIRQSREIVEHLQDKTGGGG